MQSVLHERLPKGWMAPRPRPQEELGHTRGNLQIPNTQIFSGRSQRVGVRLPSDLGPSPSRAPGGALTQGSTGHEERADPSYRHSLRLQAMVLCTSLLLRGL